MAETGENKADNPGKGNKKQRILLRTHGWPLVTVARDGIGDIKEDKCFRVRGLGKSGRNFKI